MKSVLISLTLFVSSSVFAHGTTAEQAVDSVEAAVALFQKTVPTDVRKKFQSIRAEKTGHEQFQVTIGLSDTTETSYQCVENEEVDPVVWECQ